MGTIEKKENTALEIYNTKPGTKAIEVRRRMNMFSKRQQKHQLRKLTMQN